jgi:hypothetical protein
MEISKYHLFSLLLCVTGITLVSAGVFKPKPTVAFEYLASQPAADGQRHAITFRENRYNSDYSTLTGTWIIRMTRSYRSVDTQIGTDIPVLLSRGMPNHPLPRWAGSRLVVKIPPGFPVDAEKIENCMLKFQEWGNQATPASRLCFDPNYVDIDLTP